MIELKISYRYQKVIVLLDEEDAELCEIAWRITKNREHLYARKKINGKTVYLHTLVLERKLGRSLESDERAEHKNRRSTDNTRENLRPATRSQNAANTLGRKTSSLGFHGVTRNRQGYAAAIQYRGIGEWLGTYRTPEEAHEVFKRRHAEVHGEFSPYWKEKTTDN
jgi:hypothetical protein